MAVRPVFVDVLPSLKSFAPLLMAASDSAAKKAGTNAGNLWSKSMEAASKTQVLQSSVRALEDSEQKAQAAVRAATLDMTKSKGRVTVANKQLEAAEKRLQEQTEKYGKGASQVIRAEGQVEAAHTKVKVATEREADATKVLEGAKKQETTASAELAKSQNELTKATEEQPNKWLAFGSAMGGVRETGEKAKGTFDRARSAVSLLGIGLGAVGLGQWFKTTTDQAEGFQKQLNLLVTAGGESTKNLGTLEKGIMDIAQETGVSTSQLTEGMYTMEKAQIRGANGLNVLRAAAEGATDEQVDLGVMTNALTSIMRSYNLPASQASSVTNQLVTASGAAKTTMQEFAGSLSTVLPIASAAGIGFDQVGGAIATLTSHGTSAQEATQELSNTIRQLEAPSQVASNEMQQFGISSVDVANNLGKKGLTGTIDELTSAILSKMGPSGTVLLQTFNQSKFAAQDASKMYQNLSGDTKKLADSVMDGSLSYKQYQKRLRDLAPDQYNVGRQWEQMYVKSQGFNDQLKSGRPEVQTYTEALKRMMGGATGLNTALMLSGGSTKTFRANVDAIGKSAQQNGKHISTWAQTQETAQVQTQRFNQALETSRITLGAKFLPALTSVLRGVTNFIVGVKDWTSAHPKLTKALAATVAGLTAFVTVMTGARLIMDAFETSFSITTSLLKHPIATAIVVGIIALVSAFKLAYDHSKTFRDGVNGALNFVKNTAEKVGNWFSKTLPNMFSKAWNAVKGGANSFANWFMDKWNTVGNFFGRIGAWFSGPFARGMNTAWNVVKGGAQSFWDFLKKVGNGIATVFKFVITFITTVFVSPFVIAFNVLKTPVLFLWHNVVEPAMNGIKNAFQTAWGWISQHMVEPFKKGMKELGDALNSAKKVIGDAWNAITGRFRTAWNWIKTHVVNVWNAEITGWGIIFTKVKNVILPVWDAIVGKFRTAWTWIKTHVVNLWDNEIAFWGVVFTRVKNTIVSVWDEIVGKFRDAWNWIKTNVVQPVNTAITNVGKWFGDMYNNHIMPVWNGISGTLSSGWNWINDNVFTPLKNGVHDIGQAFETTKDWIGRTWDKIKKAAADPVQWVIDVVYNNGIRAVWNTVASKVGLDLKLPEEKIKFANGGIYGGINPGYAPGVDSVPAMTSPGEAWMVPEWTRAVGAGNVMRWNRLARQSGPSAVRQDMGLSGSQHFADGGIVQNAISWIGDKASGVADWFGNAASAVAGFISDPGGSIRNLIETPVNNLLKNIGAGDWGQIIAQLPKKVVTSLIQKAKDLVAQLFPAPDVGGGGPVSGGSGGAERWRSLVLQVLSMLGQSASWADTVLRRMNQESGGNPNAINLWDSNAAAGMPSQGLMQTIPGTFRAYAGPFVGRGITDPLANIYAGVNYALHRYGSLSALNRPGGYSEGGIVPKLYDKGGYLAPGTQIVSNKTNEPELVLTKKQQDDLFSDGKKSVYMPVTINNYGQKNPYVDGTIHGRTLAHSARISLMEV